MNPILREARSSPYIGTQPEGNTLNGNGNDGNGDGLSGRLNNAVSDERFGKVKEAFETVQFNAGSSSSSTDLQFYTDSLGNMETLREWAKLHEKQRHSSDARGGAHGHHHEEQRTAERNHSKAESADNLAESGGHSSEQSSMAGMEMGESAAPTEGSNFLGKHRSETNLPGKAARDGGFRLLEKCCSVELSPAKFMVPPSRLARSKEMPNIADVDDCEIATFDG